MTLPSTSYEKPLHKAYCSALLVTFSAALGFLSAFLWRDIILAILKKYKWYDEDAMCTSTSSLCYLVLITVFISMLAAMLVVMTVKVDKYYS